MMYGGRVMSDIESLIVKLRRDLKKGLEDHISAKGFQDIYESFESKYVALLMKE